jgi:Protein of unknown function (DUF3302)
MGGPFLSYFGLGLLFFTVVVLPYAIVAIHDISQNIVESGHHPRRDAIYAASWVQGVPASR